MCGSRAETEDLVQETRAQVLAKHRSINGDPLASVLQASRSTFLESVRRRSRRPRTTSIDEVGEAHLPTFTLPADALAAREVISPVAELRPAYRDVIVAVDVVGLSYTEAAHTRKLAIGTVISRLHRGRGNGAQGMRPG